MDLEPYINELKQTALSSGWQVEGSLETQLWLYRPGKADSKRFYISAGIHGDEPAGPWAVMNLVRDTAWLEELEVWIFPLLNAEGVSRGIRENPQGLDLNRDYNQPQSPEIRRHVDILKTLPRFDACVCLHEDWEYGGSYLYFLREDPEPAWAIPVLDAMARHIPVETSPVIDGFEAVQGRIERSQAMVDRPEWPEALYLARYHTHCCFTLETPSVFELNRRVAALEAAVKTLAEKVRGDRS